MDLELALPIVQKLHKNQSYLLYPMFWMAAIMCTQVVGAAQLYILVRVDHFQIAKRYYVLLVQYTDWINLSDNSNRMEDFSDIIYEPIPYLNYFTYFEMDLISFLDILSSIYTMERHTSAY